MQQTMKTDYDSLLALTGDYSTIAQIYPEENRVEFVKLDERFDDYWNGKWCNFTYDEIISDYLREIAIPENFQQFYEKVNSKGLIQLFANRQLYQEKYRTIQEGQQHYWKVKLVKISKEYEPLRLICAFSNIDDYETHDQKMLSELKRLTDIIETNNMGMWQLYEKEGCKSAMRTSDKMNELLGLPADTQLTDIEKNDMLFERINPEDLPAFKHYHDTLTNGEHAEITYRWNHPTLGERYVRCGGIRVKTKEGETEYNGYHLDVTDQVKLEQRQNRIIRSLAQTYVFVNYLDLSDNSFITFTSGEMSDDLLMTLMSGVSSIAISLFCDGFVSDEHKDDMRIFTDLDTIQQRMQYTNVIKQQFQDENDVWYEWSYKAASRHSNGTIHFLLWTIQEIDDTKQVELRQQKLLEHNIEANNSKTMFLQNMSHEIRTPLNALFGFAQLLGLPDGSWTDEEREQFNSYIYNSYNMLDMLISDIIDVADAEHGNYKINIEPTVVNDVCRNTMQSVEFRRPAAVEMLFTTELDDNHTIQSDGRRIQQVLINYLTNACKHTEKGSIHLHCSKTEHPGKLTFSVTDTGHGIPPSKAKDVFQRFTKLNRHVQGSGLGLNICMMIADKLEGEVYLDTSYTTGARFVFVINDTRC